MRLEAPTIACRALGMILMVAAGASAAGEVSSTFLGVILTSQDTSDAAGFGTGAGVLDGLEVRVVIAIDSSRAPPDADPSPTLGRYDSHDSSDTWLRIVSVELGGRMLSAPRFTGVVTGHDADQRVLVSAAGDVGIFVDLDWEDEETGEFLDQALRIGFDGAERADDALVPLIGPDASVSGTGSFAVHRIEPGGARGAYLGFDFRVTDATITP